MSNNIELTVQDTNFQPDLIQFLLQRCPELIKLLNMFSDDNQENIQMIENFRNKKIIVKGYVQSGKTNFIISASTLFNLIGNKNIVIIIRNSTDDKIQLKNRMKHFNNELKKVLEMSDKDFSKPKNIYIEIGNASRMKKLYTKLKKSEQEYVLFVDEVDFMDYSENTKTTEELSKLKDDAYCFFGVSATIMDPILKKEDSNLIVLSKPENYRGIESFNFETLQNKSSVLTKKISNPIEDDTNLEHYLETFVNKKPYLVPIYEECHPVDTLIRSSLALDPNRRLLCYIATHFPHIPSMFYSGGGSIELYLPNIATQIKLADGSKSKIQKLRTEKAGEELDGLYHCFTSTSPSYVKQWLYENGGVNTYTHIITLTGSLASRCISYGASNFEQCKSENKLWWHLTEMYISASSTMDQPELIQTAGRLCVATPKGDNVPLTLYSTKDIGEDLIKAYWLQEELIDRANQKHSIYLEEPLWRLIQDLPIFKGKLPTKKRTLTKKVEYELNKVETKNDGGYDIKDYNGVIGDANVVDDEKEDNEILERNNNYIDKTKKRIKDSIRKGNSYISSFLNSIDINATYKIDELILMLQNSGYQQPKSYIVSLTKLSKYGFPCIFENIEDNSWKIFEDIKSAWN